jgi:2,3-bisphosphoglycerate-independent phosphoglycerate mutase
MEDIYGNLVSSLVRENEKKIVMLVLDGLGGCDNNDRGSALEIAKTPNLDSLAEKSALGLAHPVAPGITPGSGPGHLGLFGYDPFVYSIGRGVLTALGIDFPLQKGDVAARLNFCTVDRKGKIADRRAGRISTVKNKELIKLITENIVAPPNSKVFFETVSEHRALLVIRDTKLSDYVGSTDPQQTGVPPLDPGRKPYENSKTAIIVKDLMDQLSYILGEEDKANFMLARGFAMLPEWPGFKERYKLNAAAVAGYSMYRGISRLFGFDLVSDAKSAEDVCRDMVKASKDHNFVFGHYKYTDVAGEDGDLDAKIKSIEEMDKAIKLLMNDMPDVLIVTGDHSTPPSLKSHSWHPVPVLMHAPFLRRGTVKQSFNENSCRHGELGIFYAKELMPLALAHTGKLMKYGA